MVKWNQPGRVWKEQQTENRTVILLSLKPVIFKFFTVSHIKNSKHTHIHTHTIDYEGS